MNIQTAQGAIDAQISIQEFANTCECVTMFTFCQRHFLSLYRVNTMSTVASLKAKTGSISHVINELLVNPW